jgi:hypothetical protein
MRKLLFMLWVLLFLLQLSFYFFVLLYRSPALWVAIPALTLIFYVMAIRSAAIVHVGNIAIASCIGMLISWDLIAFALTASSSGSLAALFFGFITFIFAVALCFGGVALLRRALFDFGASR